MGSATAAAVPLCPQLLWVVVLVLVLVPVLVLVLLVLVLVTNVSRYLSLSLAAITALGVVMAGAFPGGGFLGLEAPKKKLA